MSTTPPPAPALTPAQQQDVMRLIHEARPRGKPGVGEVRFDTADVQPPSTEYLTMDSYLQINIFPNGTANTVTVAAKILLANGRITLLQFNFTSFTALAKNQYLQQLAEGFLLSLAVTISGAATVHRGDTFVQVGVQFGPAAMTPMYRVLASGYVTTTVALAWPEGNLQDSLTGSGLLVSAALGNPAAGTDFSFAFPANTRTWLHAFTATLTTAVAVANRTPVFLLKDSGGNQYWSLGTNTAQVASKVAEYNLGESATIAVDASGNNIITLPGEAFGYGAWSVSSLTGGIQAADQWSAIRAEYEQWVEV